MLARLRMLWVRVRDSLWFLPGTVTGLAACVALLLIELEKHGVIRMGNYQHWLWGGGAEGAQGILTAISGGLITVTGVVFSVTVVALQLASSQFTPRLLRNFTADRSNQWVLAVLIGTFTYTLLVLRVVRSGTDTEPPFVPRLAVTIAVMLVMVSIGFLIFFIDHASKSIQIAVIMDRVTRLTLEHVERLYPDRGMEAAERVEETWAEPPRSDPFYVLAAETGYLQAVDPAGLNRLAEERDLLIRMEPHMGDFILVGMPLAAVWPGEAVDEKTIGSVRRGFVLGMERTPEQDVEFGIIEIADIAVKALSPGINDPTTAIRAIDKLSEILLALGRRSRMPFVQLKDGRVRFLAHPLSFERVVGLAFDQIRHFGADNPAVGRKLVDMLTQMLRLLPEERHAPLLSQREAVVRDTLRATASVIEREAFEQMLRRER